MTKRKQQQQKSSPPSSPRMKRREIEIQKDPATVLPSLEEAFEKKDEPVVSLDELSTAVSDQSLKYVSTLGIRSATLARAGKFAAAHRDADLMTTIAPSLAQSYLCKGNIYAMEGRQAAAIRVYEKGLIKAAADTDPYYATLKRAMQTAKTRHSTRVDFIGTLPEEILPKIFSDMFIGDILNFIQVSKKWRERITQCPDPWRHVLLFESLHGFFSALPLAGKHIQSIQCEYLYRRQSMVLLKRMMYGQLSSLQKLNLRYGGTFPPEQLSVALWSVRNTLTELTIVYDKDCVLPLASVLLVCPNLSHLSFTAIQCTLQGVAESPLAGTGQLTSLILSFKSIPTHELEVLLRWCPKVKALSLYGCEPAALNVIECMQPELKVLNFDMTAHDGPWISEQPEQDIKPGLHTLCIRQHAGIRGQHIIGMLSKSQNTLTCLKLGFPINWMTGFEPIISLKFMALREVVLVFDTALRTIIISLLRQSPALEIVSFEVSDITREVFDAMDNLKHLRVFRIVNPKRLNGFRTFCQKHAALGASSPLREISLASWRTLQNDVLFALSSLPSLQTLNIQSCSGFTADGLIQFMKALSGHACLETITLGDTSLANDKTLEHLGEMENLKVLNLLRLPCITDEGVLKLADNSLSLQHFLISECPVVSADTCSRAWVTVASRKRD